MVEKLDKVIVVPDSDFKILSKREVERLKDSSQQGLHELFRRCALAVLNCGNELDDSAMIFARHRDFNIKVVPEHSGLQLELTNAPAGAFVAGKMIQGIKEHLFAVLRDILFVHSELRCKADAELDRPYATTNLIFNILRNAKVLYPQDRANRIVCWGGHSIGRNEYDYTKAVGHELGLRGMDICTGCGGGAMKGPMKGAAIGHFKQRNHGGTYIGISEPGIIAAESPNPIVHRLVIMPDIEKRLEAFLRIAHGIVIFPGGVGTAEEILYLLGVLMDPENESLALPVVLTGPPESAAYFAQINQFVEQTLGEQATRLYKIIIAQPQQVGQYLYEQMTAVHQQREASKDALYYNWRLHIDARFQQPFTATHENMHALNLTQAQSRFDLAANLRCAFSGIVAGNIKEEGIRAIAQRGNYQIRGDEQVMQPLADLLAMFVAQKRMKISGERYLPCYDVVTEAEAVEAL